MQYDSNPGGVVNPEYPPYEYGMENKQVHYMVTLIMQVGGTIPISRGMIKVAKDRKFLQIFNNHLTSKKRSRVLKRCWQYS
ncbi:hypothetical protein EPI10_024067 [Gossypium australe]|uniref:Uncharacterized protein n=1 Tax=Gossypium australe TaxID=47621 RepID=A0A5B6VXU7_9ROSI|nr:hypothetical protein EPI10_024067 [Gossypium australe]